MADPQVSDEERARRVFLFPLAEQIVCITGELESPTLRSNIRDLLTARLRSLRLDYAHAEALWITRQSDLPPVPPTKLLPKPKGRRYASHPWYGTAVPKKPSG